MYLERSVFTVAEELDFLLYEKKKLLSSAQAVGKFSMYWVEYSPGSLETPFVPIPSGQLLCATFYVFYV